jgi:pimeloyl-ACP methyl ester carboxylesterase
MIDATLLFNQAITNTSFPLLLVLKQVYTNKDYVDPELVESIRYPAQDPNAAEVFYRIVSRNTSGRPKVFFDDLLEKIDCPLLLCHGMNDPWIVPVFADKVQAKYPNCERINLDAGHCVSSSWQISLSK